MSAYFNCSPTTIVTSAFYRITDRISRFSKRILGLLTIGTATAVERFIRRNCRSTMPSAAAAAAAAAAAQQEDDLQTTVDKSAAAQRFRSSLSLFPST